MEPISLADKSVPVGRQRLLTQQQIVLPLLTLVAIVLVAAPLMILLRSSLLPAGALPFDTLSVTFRNFAAAYGDPATLRLFLNTAYYAGGSVFLGLILATVLTWLVERTDMPFRTVIKVTMFANMTIPPLAYAFGWIMLLNPNNGALNVWLKNLFRLEQHPFDVYTLSMMIFISATELVPTMFVMLSGLFRNMDPQLEKAGAVSGANYFKTARYIMLPLLTPGLLSVAIYMAMIMVQAFEIPLVMGLTAGVPVLSVYIYLLSSPEGGTPKYGLAAAFGIGLLVLAIILMVVYYAATRTAERFRVVTGKGFRPKRMELGYWRYPALIFTVVYFVAMIAPLLALLWTSLLPFYQLPSAMALNRVSLKNYLTVISGTKVQQAILNTFILVFSTATLAMLLSGLISWFAVRGKGKLTPFTRYDRLFSAGHPARRHGHRHSAALHSNPFIRHHLDHCPGSSDSLSRLRHKNRQRRADSNPSGIGERGHRLRCLLADDDEENPAAASLASFFECLALDRRPQHA